MKAWEHHNRIIRERKARAELEAARGGDGAALEKMGADSPTFQFLLTAIDQECKQLSALPKGAARTERKRELVAEFLPPVEAYLAKGERYENTALTQVMIWLFDIGDIDRAMRLARVAVEQGQPLPERYKRDIVTAVADFVLEWATARNAQKAPVNPYFSEMFGNLFSSSDTAPVWAVHDDIRIKYAKLASVLAEEAGDVRKALRLCNLAESIDATLAQVKTRKAKLEKAVAALDEAEKRNPQGESKNDSTRE